MSVVFDLYYRSPVWLQNLLVTVQGARLRRLRYGKPHQHKLGELLQSQWWPADVLRQHQLAELSALVRHAAGTVPLYRERGVRALTFTDLAELRALPLVRKDDLRAPRQQVVSSEYLGRKLQEVHTGGSTGKPLTIYCDRLTLQHNFAFFSRLKQWAGIRPGDATATFAGRTIVAPSQSKPPYWRRNAAANTLLFSSYHIGATTLPAYVAALQEFRPALIDSYPSSLEPLARFIVEQGITSVRPRAIVTSSETLFPTVRAQLEQAFGCPVFDYYGSAEMASFVSQCAAGSYHVNPEFGVLEIIREDGQPAGPGQTGEIVATGFLNRVMPLIRYATGDLASWKEGACPCGRAFPMLERIEGRQDDVVVTPDGRRVGRLDPIFKAVSSIQEAQIVQDRPDRIKVQLVAETLPDQERAALIDELHRRLGPAMKVDIVLVPRIERTGAGKLRTVVNQVYGRGAAGPSEKRPPDRG